MAAFAVGKAFCDLEFRKMSQKPLFLDLFTLCLILQLQDNVNNFILQLHGLPPHRSAKVRDYCKEHLPHRWIGRVADYTMPFTQWPSRSPDLTLCDFFIPFLLI
ncbi:hypothetical protein TNCV_1207721 [Trichonephila clavipes]|nr:hypothetical protein TNCV_1207721 [Trichonephila clavipes]